MSHPTQSSISPAIGDVDPAQLAEVTGGSRWQKLGELQRLYNNVPVALQPSLSEAMIGALRPVPR